MVGISTVLGGDSLPGPMADWIGWRADEIAFRHTDDYVDLALSCHETLAGDQPASPDGGDTLVWVWGDVYGHGPARGYEPRSGPADGSAEYCSRLYDRHGLTFVDQLNGQFALVIYDRDQRQFSIATDRFATVPLYIAETADGLALSSSIQPLPAHPDVPCEFDLDYLHEYLALRRVLGIRTPLRGVDKLPPASITTVDLADGTVENRRYWRPSYEPENRPLSYFAERLAAAMSDLFDEWTRNDLTYGVLLSGGSDSRLVQAAIDQPVVSFHNADWMSREARIAKWVTEQTGDEFHLLERAADHEARSLETTPALSNFSGWFDQAYFSEFESAITQDVDVLVSGLFADMLFAGGPLATRTVSLGSVGTVSLPVRDPIEDLDDYVDHQLKEAQPVPYFDADRPLRETLRANVERTDAGVVSHGVEFDSLMDLVMYGDYYPLGADTEAIFPQSLRQLRPSRMPFLDNRVFDIHRRMPINYFLRRNVVHSVLERLAPDLAEIPHARTGVRPKRSFPVEFVGQHLYGFYRKHVSSSPTPEPHFNHDPWPDRTELIRTNRFAIETIRNNESLLRHAPYLDFEAAEETYRSHLEDSDNTTVLYSLLTFLEMPVTHAVDGSTTLAHPGQTTVDGELDSEIAGNTAADGGHVGEHRPEGES